jgi:hypothetical protein
LLRAFSSARSMVVSPTAVILNAHVEHAALPKNLDQDGPRKSAPKAAGPKAKKSSGRADKAADRKAAQAYERERPLGNGLIRLRLFRPRSRRPCLSCPLRAGPFVIPTAARRKSKRCA